VKRRRALLRNSYLGDQMKVPTPGLGPNPASLPVLSSAFLILENRCIIFKLIREQMIDDTGELVYNGRNGFRGAKACLHSAEVIPEERLTLCSAWAASRKASAARFLVGQVRDDNTRPPLILGSGQSRSQEQNAAAVGNRDRSGPTSVRSPWAVRG
jgi:hypothetical protein